MNSEELMRVYVVDSEYIDSDSKLKVIDVPSVPFLNCRNPLYIGVRQGQVKRMQDNIQAEKLGGTSIGFWELTGSPTYLTKKGKINFDSFKEHDVIFFASADRIHEKFRASYLNFVNEVKQALC